jgi:hypothetical protein
MKKETRKYRKKGNKLFFLQNYIIDLRKISFNLSNLPNTSLMKGK